MNNQNDILFSAKFKKLVVALLFLICILLFSLDILLPPQTVHFSFEKIIGFYAIFGFVACVILVMIAKYILRTLVMRSEDYYE